MGQSVGGSVTSVSRWVGQSVGGSVMSVGGSITWLVGRWVGRLVGGRVGRLLDQLGLR